MNGRFAMATLVASFMIGALALVVTPASVSSTPELAISQSENHVSARSMIAIKNQAWPPAAMITVEPCSVAQCSDA